MKTYSWFLEYRIVEWQEEPAALSLVETAPLDSGDRYSLVLKLDFKLDNAYN